MARADEYLAWRTHLADLSDAELEARFWELVDEIVDPLVDLARTHTSPSIERSVLMRMGVDSLTCNAVVNEVDKRGLLGHGAGHVVLHCAQQWDVDVRAAAARLAAGEGWDLVDQKWGGRDDA
ncbi:MAG TPA: D-ornithine 4,5-aminomutase subunit OraS [Thermoleophilia bacterium]|nr:D-ornithine 4,5-aminomutase subunit OraS [Thermoleophilia bacterium]HQG03824.1 D-ornithine 4,5-aminomutase subunit OraS [Thermoleophilia bacterium]